MFKKLRVPVISLILFLLAFGLYSFSIENNESSHRHEQTQSIKHTETTSEHDKLVKVNKAYNLAAQDLNKKIEKFHSDLSNNYDEKNLNIEIQDIQQKSSDLRDKYNANVTEINNYLKTRKNTKIIKSVEVNGKLMGNNITSYSNTFVRSQTYLSNQINNLSTTKDPKKATESIYFPTLNLN